MPVVFALPNHEPGFAFDSESTTEPETETLTSRAAL
jgi:hypothetical protein